MKIVCFDMEGTLTPEIWQEVAKETNVSELLKTTRDIPSFSELMDYRISLMKEHNISFSFLRSCKPNRTAGWCTGFSGKCQE